MEGGFIKYLLIVLLGINIVANIIYRAEIKRRNYTSPVMKLFAGTAMLLIGVMSSGKENPGIRDRISKLNSSENVSEQQAVYREEKFIVAFIIVLLSLVFGIVGEKVNTTGGSLEAVVRNANGEGERIYKIEADFEKEQSRQFEISVGEEVIDETSANRLFDEKQEEIIERMLAGNDRKRVDTNLDFSQVNCGDISIIWGVEDDDIISRDGKIKSTKKKGVKTKVYADLSCGDYLRHIALDLTVFPLNGMKNVREYVQDYVDASQDAGEIRLPESINGNRVSYTEQRDETYKFIFPAGCALAIVFFFLKDRSLDGLMKKRNEQLEQDYPEIVCKLLLLSLAGLSVRKTFQKIYSEATERKKEHYVYREIKLMLTKMEGGLGEMAAYEEFGSRCGHHSYVRLVNLITQNIKRGSSELGNALESELNSAFFERRNSALKAGEALGTKLLAPMVMILIVCMAMIAAPAFMSFAIS